MTSAPDIERMILRWLSDLVGPDVAPSVAPEESLFAYGLDSLALVNLGIYLGDSLQTPVPIDVILEHATPRALAEYLAKSD